MTYLTKDEFKDFGFDEVEGFEKLLTRAEIAINLFLNNFYSFVDFEKKLSTESKLSSWLRLSR